MHCGSVLSIMINKSKGKQLQTIGKISDHVVEKSDELIKYTTNFRPQFFIKFPKVRIVTAIDPPFVSTVPLYKGKCHGKQCMKYMLDATSGKRVLKSFCCVGLCIDLMTFLETDMKGKFEVWLGISTSKIFRFISIYRKN